MGYALNLLFSHLKAFFGPYLIIVIISAFPIMRALTSCFNEKSKMSKLPPGPKPWPIVGNLLEMLANNPTYLWMHNLMKEMDTEIACIRLGNVHVIPVTCSTIAREILKKQDANFASRPLTMATDFVSRGYKTMALVPHGEQWKKMKKVLSYDLLSPLKHQLFQAKRNEEIDNIMFHIYNKCTSDGSSLVNVRTIAQHYCSNVLRKLIFNTRYFGKGRNDGGPGFEEEEYVDATFTLIQYIYAFCVSDYMPVLRGLDLDGHERKVKNAIRIVKKYNDPIIEQRIEKWKYGSSKTNDGEDMLDILISLKDSNDKPLLTLEEIKAQITELMIVGTDNPANAIECALAEMINEPDVLERATEELDKVVGKHRLVQESDIPKLNYVKACAREAFRLHPIAPFIPPHVSMNDTIVANYFIPKGSHVILSRHELGRNPKVWSEPHKFKPERHITGDGTDVVLTEADLKFITFSIGRRGCPSVMLGTTMTVMLLARLLHSFTWSLPANVSTINLAHSISGVFLAKPLVLVAKPRLTADLYHT